MTVFKNGFGGTMRGQTYSFAIWDDVPPPLTADTIRAELHRIWNRPWMTWEEYSRYGDPSFWTF